MANSGDDLDLISLFGLSADEAAGLGLGDPAQAQPNVAASTSDAATGCDGMPATTGSPGNRAAGSPSSTGVGYDAYADDLAVLAMLDYNVDPPSTPCPGAVSAASTVSGEGMQDAHGPGGRAVDVSRALDADPVPSVDSAVDVLDGIANVDARAIRDNVWSDDVEPRKAPAESSRASVSIASLPDTALPLTTGDDVDLAALFGLSSEEVSALGLEASSLAGDTSSQITERDDVPACGETVAAQPTFPTMYLRAVDDAPANPLKIDDADTAADLVESMPPLDILEEAASPPVPVDDNVGKGEGFAGTGAIDPLLLDAFAEESAELIDTLHVELERLEEDRHDHGALLEIRRVVHTIKGGAKLCGFEHVVTLTHSCENLLDRIADGLREVDTPTLQALFACEPILRSLVQDALANNTPGMEIGAAVELSARFDALCAGQTNDADSVNDGEDIVVADGAGGAGGAGDAPSPPAADVPAAQTDGRDEPPASMPIAGSGGENLSCPDAAAPTPVGDPSAVPTTVADARVEPSAKGAPTAPTTREQGGRRGRDSINVDLAKVDAVVAKVTEMAAHRSSYQGMVGQLMETTGEARRNVVRLHTLAAQIANDCMAAQPIMPARQGHNGRDDLDLESFSTLNTLVLQLQEAVADQQALIEKVYDTITNHWNLRATEVRADSDLQNALMNIRLIPIATMRVRLDGVVRQAAQATGKTVRWQLQGGSVAVEKNVFDRLFEPLMHLLRNAVDHGLEAPAARQEAGKSETGAIVVTARQEDNHVVITVADDGAGIAPDKIAAVAVERGVVSAERAARLSARQKIELIFTPGFSTAGSVSHISGRGVGMDVVRESCLRMGGSIDVDSRPGAGTTFTLRLPLSLSVTRGLIIREGGCYMAVPVGQITALHLVSAADIVGTPQGRIARIEGYDLPVYNLPPLPGAEPASYTRNDEVHVLQVPHEGGSLGLIVEDVLDEEEMLIKAPPPLLRGVKALLGSHTLSDGTVAPVVNLPWMLADLRPAATLAPVKERVERSLVALVVDDSMSMRVALSGTLQGAGFTVVTARDGQEALDILNREGLPALITLDIEMPRMDGLETLFAIRQMAGGEAVPVFMLTSRGGAKHRRAAEQLGATRYFTKPYRDSELAAAAREACAAA